MEAIFPPNYDEISNHYFHLGIVYQELSQKPGLARSLVQRYQKNAREAYQKCHSIRCVWYGPQHTETLRASAKC